MIEGQDKIGITAAKLMDTIEEVVESEGDNDRNIVIDKVVLVVRTIRLPTDDQRNETAIAIDDVTHRHRLGEVTDKEAKDLKDKLKRDLDGEERIYTDVDHTLYQTELVGLLETAKLQGMIGWDDDE